jgi:signal transduction histidine kinase
LQSALAGRFVQVLNTTVGSTRRDSVIGTLPPAVAATARAAAWSGVVMADGSAQIARHDSVIVLPAALADSIRVVTTRLPNGAYIGMFDVDSQLVVFVPQRNGVPSKVFAIAFDAVSPMLVRFLAADPVLPRALTHGENVGGGIGSRVAMSGVTLAARGIDSSRFRSTAAMGSLFDDMTVEVMLAEGLAPTLIIGGLPGSPIPFVIGAVVLTLALLATMVVQLQQRDKLARLREDFVSGTSHELRTPLAQIRMFAETLRLGRVRTDDERRHALVVIEREARRLEHLVENMLHVSRTDRGALRLAVERVDVEAITAEIVSDFTPLADKAGVELRAERSGPVMAMMDTGAWRQIVLNLLDNAVRYGGRGAHVGVAVVADNERARLEVIDDGPGVPVGDRQRIWERFWRGEAGRAAGITGAGIGLATVRELVEAQGGECHLEERTARGSCFVVTLPLARTAAAP